MKRTFTLLLTILLTLGILMTGCAQSAKPDDSGTGSADNTEVSAKPLEGHTLRIFCGAGMTKPFQEIADAFQAETGCKVEVTFANAGQIQSQIKTAEEGDFFIAGSAQELKPVEKYVKGHKDLVKHIPVLIVPEANPKGITDLKSLAQDGVSFIMGDVEATPIGKITKKALTALGIFDKVSVTATTGTAPQMATLIAKGEADAAITWKENAHVDGVKIVETEDLVPYIMTIPAARLTCSQDAEAADAFDSYLDTAAARDIWVKYGYELVR